MGILSSGLVASGTLPAAEGVIATTSILTADTRAAFNKVIIRGSVQVVGNATAGTITLRIRQGTTTAGALIWSSGPLTAAAAADLDLPLEGEDTSALLAQAGGGQYCITAVDSAGAGTVSGGSWEVETQ